MANKRKKEVIKYICDHGIGFVVATKVLVLITCYLFDHSANKPMFTFFAYVIFSYSWNTMPISSRYGSSNETKAGKKNSPAY